MDLLLGADIGVTGISCCRRSFFESYVAIFKVMKIQKIKFSIFTLYFNEARL